MNTNMLRRQKNLFERRFLYICFFGANPFPKKSEPKHANYFELWSFIDKNTNIR